MNPSRSGHLPIDGLTLYYEVYGELGAPGPSPLLLIPGAFMSTVPMATWVSAFAATRPVIVFDQQGHGRTPDTPRALSYPAFAADAAGLLRALEVERADVMGYSQGGGVALQLAIRYPALVRKLVLMGTAFRKDGWSSAVTADVEEGDQSGLALWGGTTVERAFLSHTPDPVAFEAYLEKMHVFGIDEQTIPDTEMRSISAPAMVVAGETDDVRPDHTVALYSLLGGIDADGGGGRGTRLLILPTTHVGMFWHSAIVAPMVVAFLDDVPEEAPSFF